MPVPKRKLSRSRRDSRSANKFLKPQLFFNCKNCQSPAMPHQACLTCGFYKGKKILETKFDRALKRNEARKAKVKDTQASSPVSEQE